MKYYEASARINARPETIWSILTDARGMTSWDSGILSLEGDIQTGQTIKLVSAASPERAFPIKVITMNHPRQMVWGSGMPLGLFKGERTFTLTPQADGTTDVHIREEFSGLMLGLIWKSMPDLQPSFDQFVSGLKAKAEATRD